MSTSSFKIDLIPSMNCTPKLSIAHLPDYILPTIDTTTLTETYGYVDSDVDAKWTYEVSDFMVGEHVPNSDCPVSGDVLSSSGFRYVSFFDSAKELQGARKWLYDYNELGCNSGSGESGDSDQSVTLASPVNYATNKPSFLPAPIFNPNQAAGGGGGTIEGLPPTLGQVVSVNYSKNEATVQLYGLNASGDLVLTDEQVIAIIL